MFSVFPEMTDYVSSGTLNPTHSLNHVCQTECIYHEQSVAVTVRADPVKNVTERLQFVKNLAEITSKYNNILFRSKQSSPVVIVR